MGVRNLRDFIEALRREGELVEVREKLSPRYEISAFLSLTSGKREAPAFLFSSIEGYDVPVVGNVLGTRKRMAMALGTSVEEMEKVYGERSKRRAPLKEVEREKAPVKAQILKGDFDILKLFPIPTLYEKDSNPFITSGITSVRDPKTGAVARGIHRLEVHDGRTLSIGAVTPGSPMSELIRRAHEEGRDLEVAVTIGVDPAVILGIVSPAPPGVDKLEIAGGLKGDGVEVVRGETVDILFPAEAEIVLEGIMPAGRRMRNGPMGEATGYYVVFEECPVIELRALNFRKDPVYQVILPWGFEACGVIDLLMEMSIAASLKSQVPSVADVSVVPTLTGLHVVFSVSTQDKGEIRRALCAALAHPFVKMAVAVDQDVNIRDLLEVEWAVATRFQADVDMILITGVKANPIDPSMREGKTAKMGIDATKPRYTFEFEKITQPSEALEKAKRICEQTESLRKLLA